MRIRYRMTGRVKDIPDARAKMLIRAGVAVEASEGDTITPSVSTYKTRVMVPETTSQPLQTKEVLPSYTNTTDNEDKVKRQRKKKAQESE